MSQKRQQNSKAQQEAAAKEKVEQEVKKQEVQQEAADETVKKQAGMTLPDVYEKALRGGKYRRKAWKKSVKDVFIRRGETKLSIGDDRHAKPYLPSQEDAIARDWTEV